MLTRARVATSIMFAVHGSVTGTFAARLPWIADHVGVTVGGLGVALLMPGVGALLAMPLSGRLVHRYDLRNLTRVLMLLWCAALVLPAVPASLPLLCAVLIGYGATAGVADVAMNAHAVLVEERLGKSVMSGFHGFWSLGGLAGSSVAALAAKFGVDARVHFAATAVVLCLVTLVGARWLLPHRPAAEVDEPPAFALPSRLVLPIGLVGLCAVFAEASGLDWSAVYVRNVLGGSASTAALTVAIFSVSMALTRFAGDAVVRRLGAALTVRIAAACALAGAVIVVLGRAVPLAIAGFGLIGVGIAVVVPLVFAAAGRLDGQPGRNIAGVAGIAYGSGLIAPGVLGGIGHVWSLTISFILVALLLAAMGAAAGALRAKTA
jgi:predicted MFS family arabinose efflux permease